MCARCSGRACNVGLPGATPSSRLASHRAQTICIGRRDQPAPVAAQVVQRPMTLDAIRSDFALLDDWEDRYRYVIELGRGLPPFPDALRTEANKVRGCASQVWLATTVHRPNPSDGRIL